MQQWVSIQLLYLMHNTKYKLKCILKERQQTQNAPGLAWGSTLGQYLLDDIRLASISCPTCIPEVLPSSGSVHQHHLLVGFSTTFFTLSSYIQRTYIIYAMHAYEKEQNQKHHAIANKDKYKVTTELTQAHGQIVSTRHYTILLC